MNETLEFYCTQSSYTDLGEYSSMIEEMPTDLSEICRIVRNVIEHYHGINKNKIKTRRFLDVDIRFNKEILARVKQLGYNNIQEPIEFENKIIGSCRTQAVLACGILRHMKIPARVRYKYCTYFIEDFNHEQAVVEYWDKEKNCWILIDPAMNYEILEYKNIKIDFDLCHIPDDKSMPVSTAWLDARAGKVDPNLFGAFSNNNKNCGLWHIRVKLLHDLACLNKIEVLEWDRWGATLLFHPLNNEEIELTNFLAHRLNANPIFNEGIYSTMADIENKIKPITGLARSPFLGDYEVIF